MKQLNEELLSVWLQLSTSINNDRVVSDIPYNESLVCNILYRNQLQNPETRLTATDLCQFTKMLKSQMNRTLNSMEEKGLIRRDRSVEDKRQVYVSLVMDSIDIYHAQHSRILKVLDAFIDRLGTEKTRQTIELFAELSKIADDVLA